MAQTQFTTTGDRLLAQLPEHQRAAASAEAFALFQSDARLTLVEAIAFTVRRIETEPARPLGPRIAAARKVIEVESASTPGVVYQVVNGVCTCPAAQFGRKCWHVRAAQQKAAA